MVAQSISGQWLEDLNLASLVEERLADAELKDVAFDLVAIGKASREMASAVHSIVGDGVQRQFIVCDRASATRGEPGDVVVGEHPIPGRGSLEAGKKLVDFLSAPTPAACTLFLLSGGASSLCVAPSPPLTLLDLGGVWDAALEAGANITTLNKLRAAISHVAGGAVLRSVQSPRSQSFVLVDNVVSGARWVASAMTYDYRPGRDEVVSLLGEVNLAGTALGERLLEGYEQRSVLMNEPIRTHHDNAVLAEPAMMLRSTIAAAQRAGYRVIDLGSRVRGDVNAVCDEWWKVLEAEVTSEEPVAFVGVGEVTVKVRGAGTGGRCQEFAWSMAGVLAELGRESVFLARASDGRDFLDGVGGAWVDESTKRRAALVGIDWSRVLATNDSYPALEALDQLLEGGHTGWNLCDVYVALM
jgi:glycerate-2-kinase